MHNNELVKNIIDTVPYKESTTRVTRSVRVFNMEADGSSVEMWISIASLAWKKISGF